MLFNKPNRGEAAINGSSMADIAFLLLIFFLVTTTINVDTGISLVLPPPSDGTPPPDIHKRNIMNIFVNARGEVLMDDHRVKLSEVKPHLKTFIDNRRKDPELSDTPEKAVVSIKTQRETPYQIYIEMLDEVMAAYSELRNEAALQKFGSTYDQLGEGGPQKSHIKEMYPKRLSIAQDN
ncbi:MAG TPA: biopolymer transporter ExbD [Balneolaceae bacterium]|nr:biopolymer transporter ExbD [Balneolaceae bacterium]|tara:strand:+ start:93073 stop:93609 length:537 start_codon:yes stop_codon:yes gene_type:complete